MKNSIQKIKYAKYFLGILLKNWTKSKDSYAQHGEDTLIEQLLGKVESFIDIGANDGVLFSNTFKFAKQGASGICIEPSRSTFLKLQLNQLLNYRVKCLRAAVTDREGLLHLEDLGYESILSKVHADPKPNTCKVRSISLEYIFKRHPKFKEADLISIDVEGHEEEVIEGAGTKPLNSKAFIIEVDKIAHVILLKKSSLKNFYPAYSNGINLVLLNKNHHFPTISNLPEGFFSCDGN